jgi:conjugative relaxase-like TrwC/TraI family protein
VSRAPLGRPFGDRKGAVAGYDLTYSAPKSLSVMWALTQDERLVHAHDTAVAAAMRHLERFGSTMRIRAANGRLHPDSQGLIFASFRQTTSRADDPQIHTHVVVSNKVQNDDGRWYALDAQYLMKHARVAGAIYQSVLRNELAHELGVAWKPIVKGQAEMLGMPPELLAEFSKRTEQIDRAVAAKVAEFRVRQGRDPNHWEHEAIEREAAEDTRCAKTGNGVLDLLTRWQDEAAVVGWDAPALWESLRVASLEAGPEPDRVGGDAIVAELSTAGSTWNRAQVMWALCDFARPQASLPGDEWHDVL